MMLGWLLAMAAAAGQEANPEAAKAPNTPAPEPAKQAEPPQDPYASVVGDPFGSESNQQISPNRMIQQQVLLRVRAETWELDSKIAAMMLDQIQTPDQWEGWRKEQLRKTDSVLVYSPSAAVDAGPQATTESITERIYPTEYQHSGADAEKKKEKEQSRAEAFYDSLTRAAWPTSFETRNTGVSFGVTARPVNSDKASWDLLVSLEDVRLEGTESFGAEALAVTMPTFSSFRSNGLVRLSEGRWQMFSVQEPPRGMDTKPSGKSWITLIRVDRAR